MDLVIFLVERAAGNQNPNPLVAWKAHVVILSHPKDMAFEDLTFAMEGTTAIVTLTVRTAGMRYRSD